MRASGMGAGPGGGGRARHLQRSLLARTVSAHPGLAHPVLARTVLARPVLWHGRGMSRSGLGSSGGIEVSRTLGRSRGSAQRKPKGREDLRFDPSGSPELAGITDVGVHST